MHNRAVTADQAEGHDYQRVCAVIRARIAAGTYQPGQRLPSLKQVEAEFGVTRGPARQAYVTLVAEGTVEGRERSGYFVPERVTLRETSRWYRRGSGSPFYADERAAGRRPNLDSADSRVVPADEHIASLISAQVGEQVTQTDYVFSSDGRPVMLSRSWELLRITKGRLEGPEVGWSKDRGVLDRFDAMGVHATHVIERLRARAATADEARKLEVRPGTPVLENERTYVAGEDGLRFETAVIVTSPDYRQVYELPVTGEPPN